MLHGACAWEAGERKLAFFRVQWLQPAMKGTSCVCGGCGPFDLTCDTPLVFCNAWTQIAMAAWMCTCCCKRIVITARILHGVCFGEEAGTKP